MVSQTRGPKGGGAEGEGRLLLQEPAPTRALHGAAEPWGSRAILGGPGTMWVMLDRHTATEMPPDGHTTTTTVWDGQTDHGGWTQDNKGSHWTDTEPN